MTHLPDVAISILQPFGWLVANGYQDVENRNTPIGYRGAVLIHTGKGINATADQMLRAGLHPCYPQAWAARPPLNVPASAIPKTWEHGGIIGVAEIVDCVVYGAHPSAWCRGPYGWVIANARPLPFMPMRGQLGFFKATYVQPGEAA